MTGADVLEVLVARTARAPHDQRLEPAAHASALASDLRDRGRLSDGDGRVVRPKLQRLEEAGLATSGHPARRLKSGSLKTYWHRTVWSPTDRGREVDAILEKRTVSRGGTFRPLVACGIDQTERLALR